MLPQPESGPSRSPTRVGSGRERASEVGTLELGSPKRSAPALPLGQA